MNILVNLNVLSRSSRDTDEHSTFVMVVNTIFAVIVNRRIVNPEARSRNHTFFNNTTAGVFNTIIAVVRNHDIRSVAAG